MVVTSNSMHIARSTYNFPFAVQSLVCLVADGMSKMYNRFVALLCVTMLHNEKLGKSIVTAFISKARLSSQLEFAQSSWKIVFAYNHFDVCL